MSLFTQVRWLKQAEAGTLAPEDEEEEDVQDFDAFDVGPPGRHHFTLCHCLSCICVLTLNATGNSRLNMHHCLPCSCKANPCSPGPSCC